jgi:ABC-2 type transport system permease protein
MTTTSVPVATSSIRSARVTQRSVVRAEWIKFRSVRSNVITLVAAGVVLIALGTMFSSIAGGEDALPPNATAGTDSLSMSFGAMNLSQLVLGVLGAMFAAGEYATGLIRTMFAVVGSRNAVLRAKAIVLGGSSWVVMTIASFAVFFAGKASYGGDGVVYGIGDDGVVRAVLGGGVYSAGIIVMGLALGFVLRSSAAAIGTLVAVLMIAPGFAGLLPDSVGTNIGKVLPSNAGQAFMNVAGSDALLSPSAGFAVFTAWVIGLVGVAVVALRQRDA